MTQMHPDDIESLPEGREGEKRVFRFLKEVARPDKDFVCWHEPSINGRRADFVLFAKDLGLLVLEVKDWEVWQIRQADSHSFTVHFSGEDQQKTNPEMQAKGYADRLMQLLRRVPALRQRNGEHRGQLKIPVGRAVVFTNISKDEYTRWNLDRIIPQENVFLKDDLDPCSEILRDPSGQAFRRRIEALFLFPFAGLVDHELAKMKQAIWPEVQITLPLRDGTARIRYQTEVRRLDEKQARVALNLKHGHQIIKGPPGSGKTLVLVHRCCHLRKHDPKVKRVLLACYNIALVSYIKRVLMENGVGLGEGVSVCHFYDLCSKILDEKIDFAKNDSGYYEAWTELALESVENGESKIEPFDAIFVDEAQDLDDRMIKVLVGLLKEGGDLLISLDPYQDIYKRRSSWRDLGIQVRGRSRYLKNVYRNTREIFEFTQKFIGEDPVSQSAKGRFPFESVMHGPKPELRKCLNHNELEEFVVEDISGRIKDKDFERSEIAVIYDDKAYGPDGFIYDPSHSPRELVSKLEAAGIPTKRVKDVRSKEEFDITTDRVTVISIHSAKGIDFDLVYLIGVDGLNVTDATRDQLIKTVYVGMTRAKYRLVIPFALGNELINRMRECLPPW